MWHFRPPTCVTEAGRRDRPCFKYRDPTHAAQVRGGVWPRCVVHDDDATARVWDLKRPAVQPVVRRGHEGPIGAPGFAPDRRLATADFDESTVLLNMSIFRMVGQAKIIARRNPTSEEREKYVPGRP